ncbi:MAG: nucleotidyltransferase domain-containing protein [Syntrophomonas sp.]|uniref:nucleotidyltransferase family protein n=1 Tax=Syntrophomonas sp. TaxID=2053627 RepID=UPI00261B3F5F|nr:nucleotidyltransferase domain-containing protein [Syntrophomonas sp.]MDD4625759.1 nucleotidyltransferase domain-containing protein [Syntrophomonas sp.]
MFNVVPISYQALTVAKKRLLDSYPIRELILFGSVARSQAGPDSDIDLLIVTERLSTDAEYDAICGEIYETNLLYDTQITPVIVDADSWYQGILTLTPLHSDVMRGGVPV